MDAEPIWLDEGQQRDWRSAIVGMTYLMAAFSRDLETATGLSMAEYELLVRLSESPSRRVRMSDLASQVAHSRSRVTHTVNRLERAGYVDRHPIDDDRRGVEAHLTDAGFVALEAAAIHHVRSARSRLVDVVTPEQLAALGDVMRTALDAGHVSSPILDPSNWSTATEQQPPAD